MLYDPPYSTVTQQLAQAITDREEARAEADKQSQIASIASSNASIMFDLARSSALSNILLASGQITILRDELNELYATMPETIDMDWALLKHEQDLFLESQAKRARTAEEAARNLPLYYQYWQYAFELFKERMTSIGKEHGQSFECDGMPSPEQVIAQGGFTGSMTLKPNWSAVVDYGGDGATLSITCVLDGHRNSLIQITPSGDKLSAAYIRAAYELTKQSNAPLSSVTASRGAIKYAVNWLIADQRQRIKDK
jgi:hypothetical protein